MVTLRQAVGLQVDGEVRERRTQRKLLEGAHGPCKVSARTPAILVISGICFDSRTGSVKSGFGAVVLGLWCCTYMKLCGICRENKNRVFLSIVKKKLQFF